MPFHNFIVSNFKSLTNTHTHTHKLRFIETMYEGRGENSKPVLTNLFDPNVVQQCCEWITLAAILSFAARVPKPSSS